MVRWARSEVESIEPGFNQLELRVFGAGGSKEKLAIQCFDRKTADAGAGEARKLKTRRDMDKEGRWNAIAA